MATPLTKMNDDALKLLLHGRSGMGKGHPVDSVIPSLYGPIRVGDIEPGDFLFGSDGNPVRVYGVWDRGLLPVYNVTFSDGSQVTVDGDHLWTLRIKDNWRTMSTRDIDPTRGRPIPDRPCVKYPYLKGLPLPPYLMGLILADGCLSGNSLQVTKNNEDVIRKAEEDHFFLREITHSRATARQWRVYHPGDHAHYSIVINTLRDLGLWGCLSGDKFIPEEYLLISEAQRRDLLAGLMDGDGRVTPSKGQAVYSSTSEELIDGVVTLMRSLGHHVTKTACRGDGTLQARLITDRNPFGVSENVTWWKPQKVDNYKVIMKDIEPAGEAEVRCLAVEAPDALYVSEDYIVTHNTTFGSTIAQSCKTLYIDLPGEKGIKSIKNASYADNIMVERPQSVTEISQLFWDTQTGQVDCQAVMLESISALQKMYVRYLLGISETSVQEVTQNPKGLDMQGWGKVLSFMTDQIVFWYNLADSERDNPIHIVMTSQSKTVEDEDTGETEVSPDVSKGSRAIVEASPDYIGYCFVEEGESESLTEEKWNFCVRFGPHDMIRTKVREDADSSKKLPYVLGRKSRPTVPKLAKRLGIPLT